MLVLILFYYIITYILQVINPFYEKNCKFFKKIL